jgi:serine/threonine protein kinase
LTIQEPFGRYTLVDRLGYGGMAEVFLARATSIGGFEKMLAIKRLLPHCTEDRQTVELLADEAKITVRLTHPNIVQVFDFGEINDTYYIAMEYVDGLDLRSLVRVADDISKPLPVDIAIFIVTSLLDALEFAHTQVDLDGSPLGIIHRDVSPHNILISRHGQVKLSDFGVARAAISSHVSVVGDIRGKFSYMPPEQVFAAHIDHRVDIFAAGAILYELLTGKQPYRSASTGDQIRQLNAGVAPPSMRRPELPEAMDVATLRALEKDPERRYPSAAEFAHDLRKILKAMQDGRVHRPEQRLSEQVAICLDDSGPEDTAPVKALMSMEIYRPDATSLIAQALSSTEGEVSAPSNPSGATPLPPSAPVEIDDPQLAMAAFESDTDPTEIEIDVRRALSLQATKLVEESPPFAEPAPPAEPTPLTETDTDLQLPSAARVAAAKPLISAASGARTMVAATRDLEILATDDLIPVANVADSHDVASFEEVVPTERNTNVFVPPSHPMPMDEAFSYEATTLPPLKNRTKTTRALSGSSGRLLAAVLGGIVGAAFIGIIWLATRSASAPDTPVQPDASPKKAATADAGGKAAAPPPTEDRRTAEATTQPDKKSKPPPAVATESEERRENAKAVVETKAAVRETNPANTPPPSRGFGSLSVNANPWGTVYVDGRPLANTPLLRHRLSAGTHRVYVYHVPTKKKSSSKRIRIKRGRELRLMFK